MTGAFTYINHVSKSSAKSQKNIWLQELIKRRGKKCATVALANKTVRTAFSLIKNNTKYTVQLQNIT